MHQHIIYIDKCMCVSTVYHICVYNAYHVLYKLQEVTHQLQHMCNLVLSATPGRYGSGCTLLDLTSIQGMPIMPTLSGWLLQYPVVYLAHPDTAVMMAQLLSEAALVLYDVQVAGLLIEVGLQCHRC